MFSQASVCPREGGVGISRLISFLGGISGTRSPLGGMSRGWGGYVRGGYPPPPELGPWIPLDTVGKRAVRILMDCCLAIKTRLSII